MRVSYDWLKTMIDLPEDPKTLSDEFIRTGTEVEAIDTVGESFDHVVTAKVLTKTPHPDSDHMYVCSVDVGDKNLDENGSPAPLQIVCGAQNFEAGRWACRLPSTWARATPCSIARSRPTAPTVCR